MKYLYCPECGGLEFTEGFTCQDCHTDILTGIKKKPNLKRKAAKGAEKKQAAAEKELTAAIFKRKIYYSAGSVVLCCFLILSIFAIYPAKTKSLKTVSAQLFVQNETNKFAVHTDEDSNLTTVTLTQEEIKLFEDTKNSMTVKFLIDCTVDDGILTQTPEFYTITVLSNNEKRKNLDSAQFTFQTDNGLMTLEKQNAENWRSGGNEVEYVSYRISRKELVKIANSEQTSFQIGKFKGQMNFPQQQAVKSFLVATSTENKSGN